MVWFKRENPVISNFRLSYCFNYFVQKPFIKLKWASILAPIHFSYHLLIFKNKNKTQWRVILVQMLLVYSTFIEKVFFLFLIVSRKILKGKKMLNKIIILYLVY